MTTDATASLRDARHRDVIRVTVWYPAAADAVEHKLTIDGPDGPLFEIGDVADNAPFGSAERLPVILLSHGFGGAARIMGWFGIPLARDGYIVSYDRQGAPPEQSTRRATAGSDLRQSAVHDDLTCHR